MEYFFWIGVLVFFTWLHHSFGGAVLAFCAFSTMVILGIKIIMDTARITSPKKCYETKPVYAKIKIVLFEKHEVKTQVKLPPIQFDHDPSNEDCRREIDEILLEWIHKNMSIQWSLEESDDDECI